MGKLSANFGVSMTFLSRFVGQHLSDASRDLAIFTFDLVRHGVVGDMGLRTSQVYQVSCS